MFDLTLMMLNSLLVGLRGQAAVQAEIIALRHQLTVRTRVRIEFLDSTRFEDFDASRVRCDAATDESWHVVAGLSPRLRRRYNSLKADEIGSLAARMAGSSPPMRPIVSA